VVSLKRQWAFTCDECGREFHEDGELHERDVLMPEGWTHTQTGEDICPWCWGKR